MTHDQTIILKEWNKEALQKIIYNMESPEARERVIVYPNVDEVFKAIAGEFTVVQAAGGCVYTSQKEILLIFRRKKWDLPKGKLDAGEDLATCAIREVEEETGLRNMQLEQPLTITYHTYYEKGLHILKESHWYIMYKEEKQILLPQVEEDIEKCEWVKIENLASYLENALPSVIDVINKGIKTIQETNKV